VKPALPDHWLALSGWLTAVPILSRYADHLPWQTKDQEPKIDALDSFQESDCTPPDSFITCEIKRK
jgi:hypothetical protein